MKIVEIKDQSSWNNFIKSSKLIGGCFLQSWEWGQFQGSLGRKFFRLGVLNNNQTLMASALVIKHNLPLGKNYLYSPRGPIFLNQEGLNELFSEIKKLALKENSIFFRLEPLKEIPNLNLLKIKDVQPSQTLILDITRSENELLSAMKPKTRYNIRLAQKRGMEVRTSSNPKETEEFYKLIKITTKRDKFKAHPKIYYQKILETLGAKNLVKLFIASYQNKILAANLVMFLGKTVTYLHGASSNEHRNLMAPYLLQWKAVQEAKKRGFQYYDFWGIAKDSQPQEAWFGLTRFKQGFGGRIINYPGTFDLIFNNFWYKLYQSGRKFF